MKPHFYWFPLPVYTKSNKKYFKDGKRKDYIPETTGYKFPIADYGLKSDVEEVLREVIPNYDVRHL